MTGNGSKKLRRYYLRDERKAWLATVVLGDDGFFAAVSEYGNYAFWWGSAGDCFRTFVSKIGGDYLLSKISRTEYDGRATEAAVRRHILELRRERELTREDAATEWSGIAEFDDLRRSENFAMWFADTQLEGASELYEEDFPEDARAFAEKVLPLLQRALTVELSAERAKTGDELRAKAAQLRAEASELVALAAAADAAAARCADVARSNAGERAEAIIAGHTVQCAEFGNDASCPAEAR